MFRRVPNLNRSFTTKTVKGFTGAVGNTPLLRLEHISKRTGCEVFGKAEFQNPGGSVKDRAALGLIENAERLGQLKPGGTVVEGTAGNTGIGLAHVCRAKGYKCVIYMPDSQSQEKIDLLRMLGADVRPVPAVAYENPKNYNHQAKEHAEAAPNAVWTNQFDNTSNAEYHFKTTGPEIWEQTSGKIDAFTCSTGTGGTLAGVAKFLREVSDGKVKSYLADPPGSVLHSYMQSGGKLVERSGSSITEGSSSALLGRRLLTWGLAGIGQGRITDNLGTEIKNLAGSLHITDEKSIKMVYEMLDTEGIYIGASSALNVVAAEDLALQLGPGKAIVTMLCDGAYRYQSRLFSRKWLQSKGLEDAIPAELQHYIVLE